MVISSTAQEITKEVRLQSLSKSSCVASQSVSKRGSRLIFLHTTDIPSRWHATSSTSDLHTFYSTSDVVVNTLPSSKHTQRFVDEAAFRSMKPDAIYVNIGRGDTTDQGKLIEALEAGLKKSSGQEGELRIGGACKSHLLVTFLSRCLPLVTEDM